MNKIYIGDGVYVEWDGYAFVLTTENGIEITNTIVLEPDVYHSLKLYCDAPPPATDAVDPADPHSVDPTPRASNSSSASDVIE